MNSFHVDDIRSKVKVIMTLNQKINVRQHLGLCLNPHASLECLYIMFNMCLRLSNFLQQKEKNSPKSVFANTAALYVHWNCMVVNPPIKLRAVLSSELLHTRRYTKLLNWTHWWSSPSHVFGKIQTLCVQWNCMEANAILFTNLATAVLSLVANHYKQWEIPNTKRKAV